MSSSSQQSNQSNKQTLERLRENPQTRDGGSLFDRLLGKKTTEQAPKPSFGQMRKEFTIFTHERHQEEDIIPREIEQLKAEIRQEIEALKKANAAVVAEAAQIEKAAMQTIAKKGGVYHVRFMEVLLHMLRSLRAKAGEARTWLAAMQTKKKKRGSLFAAHAKKKGTQYSLSQELQNARSVQ